MHYCIIIKGVNYYVCTCMKIWHHVQYHKTGSIGTVGNDYNVLRLAVLVYLKQLIFDCIAEVFLVCILLDKPQYTFFL